MGDWVTLIVVVGASALAVGLLVALNAFMGGWTRARFASLEAAAERIKLDVMDFKPGDRAVLDEDRLAALVVEGGGQRIGLAVCLGDGVAVRVLRLGELSDVEVSGLKLVLTLDDYTLPKVTLRLTQSSQTADWQDTLRQFVRDTGHNPAHA